MYTIHLKMSTCWQLQNVEVIAFSNYHKKGISIEMASLQRFNTKLLYALPSDVHKCCNPSWWKSCNYPFTVSRTCVFGNYSDESTASGHHCHSLFVLFIMLFVFVVLISIHFKRDDKKYSAVKPSQMGSLEVKVIYSSSTWIKDKKYHICILLWYTKSLNKRGNAKYVSCSILSKSPFI